MTDKYAEVQVTGKERPVVPVGEAGSISWVCGEVATVEVEIRNPTVIPIKVGSLRKPSANLCFEKQFCWHTGQLHALKVHMLARLSD